MIGHPRESVKSGGDANDLGDWSVVGEDSINGIMHLVADSDVTGSQDELVNFSNTLHKSIRVRVIVLVFIKDSLSEVI